MGSLDEFFAVSELRALKATTQEPISSHNVFLNLLARVVPANRKTNDYIIIAPLEVTMYIAAST